MNKSVLAAALGLCVVSVLAAGAALLLPPATAQAQAGAAPRLLPLGASGQLTWYLDTDKKLVVMCNAFSDNSIECRSKPMP